MRSSTHLLNYAYRITLFTRTNCSLCDTAKSVLCKVKAHRPFDLMEINIMEPNQKVWRDQYEFDTPVIHVMNRQDSIGQQVPAAHKLMHRFTEQEVELVMDRAANVS